MENQNKDQDLSNAQSRIDKSIKELVTSLRQQNKLLSEYYQKLEKHQSKTTKAD